MAQVKRKGKRTRKHRGNAAGIIQKPAGSSGAGRQRRPQTKEEIRLEARQRRADRLSRAPTWRGAVQRAGIAAAMFAVLVVIVFRENPATAVALSAFMLVVYIPLSYMTDKAIYNWRQKKNAANRG
jgi:hypothetical protein